MKTSPASGLNLHFSLLLSVTSGLAVQHFVLSCGRLVLPERSVHVGAPEGVSLLREGVQDREDPSAAGQKRRRRSPNQVQLQRSHSGELVPAEADHDVEFAAVVCHYNTGGWLFVVLCLTEHILVSAFIVL